MSDIETQKAEFQKIAEKISAQIDAAAGSEEYTVPTLALTSLRAFKRLQDGNEDERLAAQRWLRGMWDNLDIHIIQPGMRCKTCRKKYHGSAAANYVVLEGYFSGYGDVTKEQQRLEGEVARRGGRVNAAALDELAKQLATLILGVHKIGGRIIG